MLYNVIDIGLLYQKKIETVTETSSSSIEKQEEDELLVKSPDTEENML